MVAQTEFYMEGLLGFAALAAHEGNDVRAAESERFG
jgi:hypothetical protein